MVIGSYNNTLLYTQYRHAYLVLSNIRRSPRNILPPQLHRTNNNPPLLSTSNSNHNPPALRPLLPNRNTPRPRPKIHPRPNRHSLPPPLPLRRSPLIPSHSSLQSWIVIKVDLMFKKSFDLGRVPFLFLLLFC